MKGIKVYKWTGGIEIWKKVMLSKYSVGTVCFCCHEPLAIYGAKTDRKRSPNRICGQCIVQWESMPERMLFELPRHRKLPKGELFQTGEVD